MDLQVIIARVESIVAAGVEGAEKIIHDALDSVEVVLGINPGEDTGSTGAADASGAAQGNAGDAATGDAGNVAAAASSDANATDAPNTTA